MGRRSIVPLLLTGLAALALGGCGGSDSKTTAGGSVRLQVSAPADGSRVQADRITVRGTVDPPDAGVMIVGQAAQVGNGVFTGSVPVHAGSNTIDVVASAPGRSPATTTITVRGGGVPSSSGKATPMPAPSSSSSAGTGVPLGSTRDCGGGTYAGPNTTCAFAENVRSAHEAGESSVVDVSSPATGKTYTMYCTGGATNVCTGGNNASVYFAQRGTSYDTGNCGGGLSVGPNTSCAFAENVRQAYDQQGAGTVNAYSPTTGRTYTMYCTADSPHVCTGGNGAAVYFP